MDSKKRQHIVITGTGRAGTTFLVQILTHLGLDTGFTPDNMVIDKNARAGLEHDIRNNDVPYIVKSPWFCDYVGEVLNREDIDIEHIFIPIRDSKSAAASRYNVFKNTPFFKRIITKSAYINGGTWGTKRKNKQEVILIQKLYDLLLSLSNTNIPVTLLKFPRIVNDSEYLFEKLKNILHDIEYHDFKLAFEKTARPDLVHSFNKNDSI
ncbi:MAG: hypothetical protein HND52_06240 [Ignavibacteriae bacterium]|nr:hypothetical protein [Ignavibacteriota bacterium]NOG97544.1 hypothetical protein [Ignavibacteriota bacterium]